MLSRAQSQAVAERVAELRGNMRIRAFARKCEIDEKTVRRLESGDSDPALSTLLALVRGLNLASVEQVLPGHQFGTEYLEGLRGDEGDEGTQDQSA